MTKQGKYDEAIACYNRARELYLSQSIKFLATGNDHYNKGEYIAAIRYYEEAIKEEPTDKYAWYNKANALRMLHRNSEAEAAYAKALLELTAK